LLPGKKKKKKKRSRPRGGLFFSRIGKDKKRSRPRGGLFFSRIGKDGREVRDRSFSTWNGLQQPSTRPFCCLRLTSSLTEANLWGFPVASLLRMVKLVV
jgi:hypothetical protein